jgi:hypothetical protein
MGSGEHNPAAAEVQGGRSGVPPDVRVGAGRESGRVPRFLIEHRHDAHECGVVFASFRGFASPLRGRPAAATCADGGHAIWWCVEAADEDDALLLVPSYVAARATATRIGEVRIP